MLIALQCHERGIVPQRVAGFRAWLKLGRCVRKNEKALRILAPVTVKERRRWTAAGRAEAQHGFRCVNGHRDLPALTAAIRRELDPTPTEEAAAARKKKASSVAHRGGPTRGPAPVPGSRC
jgi:N-terminal domain of anti-restriction factor ArdC